MLFEEYLINNNINSETYLDNQLSTIIFTNEIPEILKNCICCQRHSNNIMCFHNYKCKCPCRHFTRILQLKIDEINI